MLLYFHCRFRFVILALIFFGSISFYFYRDEILDFFGLIDYDEEFES